jgi:hypothetical protein
MKPLIEAIDRPLRSSQQDVRLYYKRILPSLPRPVRVQEKASEVGFFKTTNMGTAEDNRTKIFLIRLKPGEYEQLEKRFKKTRFRKISEYARSLILEKPVTVFYRDKAMDEVLEELILLRRELNAIGNNLNQAVHQINSEHGHTDSKLWMNLLSVVNSKLEPSINQIKERMNQYAEIWSQKLRAVKA